MIVCHCHVVRAEEIRSHVRLGAETIELVALRCGASAKCGGCVRAVEATIHDERARARVAVPARD